MPRHRVGRLAQLAKQIEAEFPDLRCVVDRFTVSTDRKIPGTRLRWPGKGRTGTRLCVFAKDSTITRPLFEHRAAETYRTNEDVVRWIEDERKRRAR